MKTNLKKAATLATSLAAIVVPLEHTVSISVYSEGDPQKIVEDATKELKTSLDKALDISAAVFIIRKLIGEANQGRINQLLTERAAAEKGLAILNSLATARKPLDFDEIAKRRAALRDKPEVSSGFRLGDSGGGVITVLIPTLPLVEKEIRLLKKERVRIEDELAELNFKTTIEIPDEVVQVLRNLDLI